MLGYQRNASTVPKELNTWRTITSLPSSVLGLNLDLQNLRFVLGIAKQNSDVHKKRFKKFIAHNRIRLGRLEFLTWIN